MTALLQNAEVFSVPHNLLSVNISKPIHGTPSLRVRINCPLADPDLRLIEQFVFSTMRGLNDCLSRPSLFTWATIIHMVSSNGHATANRMSGLAKFTLISQSLVSVEWAFLVCQPSLTLI